ncbi:hypothetical protein [Streptomyces mirabilis]|uniref:SPW repeat-containing protein n=1 Tax=Streptomyces mirabilis TaxID=68239 RepID=A0ABU3UPD2_9ACTN|nr:hypothetical protein [Streptomyces mirabilis]MDU8995776.1 hypothetical protein [Streptomyces mirabilis]
MSRRQTLQVTSYVIGGSILIGSLALRLNSWQEWGYAAAFYVGAGGLAYLFHQWRRRGNLAARTWCLAGFGTFALTVIVGSVDDSAGVIISGLGLSIGLVGALTTLLHEARQRRQSKAPSLDR